LWFYTDVVSAKYIFKLENKKMKLLLNIVRKDLLANKVVTIAITLFIIMSAIMMAVGFRVTGTMISSLNGLNEVAKPPDYIQMHKGIFDEDEFRKFSESKSYIKDSQIVKMLNIKNANIIYDGETFEKILMDNGFVVQNKTFDFLLDQDNNIATVKNGEVGISVFYAEELGIKLGDKILIRESGFSKEFVVSSLIRDAMMNAPLTSSKRFLVSQSDMAELSNNIGEWEYIFEFLLEEDFSTAILQEDYINSNLPSNGVAITNGMIVIMNSFSFGLVAIMIIALSTILILISLLCLSYIIKATLSDESTVIGEMKAIGMPVKSIKRIYLIKYIAIVFLAVIIGFFSSIRFSGFLDSPIILYCGKGSTEWMKTLFPIVGLIILSAIVILKTSRIIDKNLKNTVLDLLKAVSSKKVEGYYALPKKKFKFPNLTLAFGELKCKYKQYIVILIVFILSSFIMLLPINMQNTVKDDSFITYMGVAESDIRVDIQYTENIDEEKDLVISHLENDPDISKFAIYKIGHVRSVSSDGKLEYLRVESGDSSGFPVKYLEGKAPESKNEIALSYLNSIDLNISPGDNLKIQYRGVESELTVTGIYQDITYGGKTTKADIDFAKEDIEVYIIYIETQQGVNISEKTDELRIIFQNSKITPIRDFVSVTLGGITENMKYIQIISIAISLFLIMLITTLMLKLIITREKKAIAIKKSIGFTSNSIRLQIGFRLVIVLLIGIITGTRLANDLGEVIFGLMLSSMGASKITLLIEPLTSYLLCPAAQIVTVILTIVIVAGAVKNSRIKNQINV